MSAPPTQKRPRIAAHRGREVSALDAHVGFWLRFVSNHVSAEFRRLVEAKGVTVSEWVALRQLFDAGRSSAAELIDALGMTKGAVSKVVTRLEGKGLVARTAHDTDGRAQQVVLTPAGRKLVPVLAGLADRNDEAFFAHLDDDQRDGLLSMMKEIVRLRGLKDVPVD